MWFSTEKPPSYYIGPHFTYLLKSRRRGKGRIFGAFLFLVIALSVVAAQRSFCQGEYDPWYVDADTHWAGNYIYVLWQERVTDGWVSYFNGYYRAYFEPENPCVRAEFLVLLAKVLSLTPYSPGTPSYPDVHPDYYICFNKPAYEWIEAGVKEGISFVPKGQRFEPKRQMTREDAVDLLIRCLDMYEHAQSLTQTEVQRLLGQFRDGSTTSWERRNTMACAIKYGIIDGYDDDTIRPKATLLRCHAATIVYRSCLIRMNASIDTLTPDGDGVDDVVTFYLSYLKNRGIAFWRANIQNQWGEEVFAFNPENRQGNPPATLSWDGRAANGTYVPSGRYYYQAMVRDRAGRQFFSVRKPLLIIRYELSGYLYPYICKTGQILTVNADTEPSALNVSAVFQDNSQRRFASDDDGGTSWTLNRVIDSSLPFGLQKVVVTAYFEGAVKRLSLEFIKEPDVWLDCWVSPSRASWGQGVQLVAETSATVQGVQASLFDLTVTLVKTGQTSDGARWTTKFTVPHGVADKDYPVVFTATFGQRKLSKTCTLAVNNDKLKDLVFTLTK